MDQIFNLIASSVTFWPAVIIFLIVGIAGLKYGADGLVTGSSNIGFRIGISATMIGLTIVAFGTSAPELVVSVLTAVEDNPELCLGNVIGSNIANTTLILGAAAMIFPMTISKDTVQKDAPLNIFAIALVLVLSVWGNGLSRLDGFLLVFTFAVWMGWLIRKSLRQSAATRQQRDESDGAADVPHFHRRSVGVDILLIAFGLVALVVGAQALVKGAIEIAQVFKIPDVVVGLTIIAAGTSLPEFAVSIMAAIKKHDDISVGNIMGSNIFNALLILGIAAWISPISFLANGDDTGNRESLIFDIPICVGTGVLLLVLIQNRKIGRGKGFILTAFYIAYIAFLGLRKMT